CSSPSFGVLLTFPTRRSSVLGLTRALLRLRGRLGSCVRDLVHWNRRLRLGRSGGLIRCRDRWGRRSRRDPSANRGLRVENLVDQDRKSTRLNSSHVKSSYDVI